MINVMSQIGFSVAAASTKGLDAIAAAHAAGTLPAMRDFFVSGSLAKRLNPDATKLTAKLVSDALKVMKSAGVDAKNVKAGKARRNEAQEAAYTAARKDWSRAIADAGVKSSEKRGATSRKAKAGKVAPKAGKAGKVQTPAAPKVASIDNAKTYLRQHMAMLVTFATRNKTVLVGEQGDAINALIADFVTRVNKIA